MASHESLARRLHRLHTDRRSAEGAWVHATFAPLRTQLSEYERIRVGRRALFKATRGRTGPGGGEQVFTTLPTRRSFVAVGRGELQDVASVEPEAGLAEWTADHTRGFNPDA